MKWTYKHMHLYSGETHEATFEAESMFEALSIVNAWNREIPERKFWLVV